MAAVVVPWHVWIYVTQGHEFFDMYAGATSWRRYLNPVHLPGVPVILYGVFGLAALFPWSGLAIPAIRVVWRERHDNQARFFLAAYVVGGVLFFGLSPGVIFGKYLLPMLPACAVLIAWHVGRQSHGDRAVASWTTTGIGSALIPASAYLKMANPGQAGTEVAVVVALLGATAIAGGLAWRRATARRGMIILAGGAAITYLVLLAIALPRVVALYPERDLAHLVNGRDGPCARVAVYRPDTAESMFVFYLDAPRIERLRDERDALRFAAQAERGWILEREASPLPEAVRRNLTRVAGDARVGLFASRRDRPRVVECPDAGSRLIGRAPERRRP
jgi:4-amino-4-deoxy-L-arabinose transferase-like glycosyltransferase